MKLFEGMAPTGDCYEAAGKYMMVHSCFPGNEKGLILVHGEVTGQGELDGMKYGHAWVEKGNNVIDVSRGRSIKMPKKAYYALGRIGKNIHKYTTSQFRRRTVAEGHWGPWDLVTESGL